jgi:hypothetical protein
MGGDSNFLDLARRSSREEFALGFPCPFLVYGRVRDEADFRFKTLSQTVIPIRSLLEIERPDLTMNMSEAMPFSDGASAPAGAVLPVVKSRRNQQDERITVGRSRQNDLILLSPQVSKQHADLLPNADGSFDLRDRGSSNGTFFHGRRLVGDERVRLTPGDALRFGVLDTLFLDARQLHDWLLAG